MLPEGCPLADQELSYREDRRQIEHVAPLAFCFLLRFLPYPWLLVLSVGSILYGIFGRDLLVKGTHRPDELARGYSRAKIAYAVSVLVLLLVFRGHLYLVAAGWTVMSIGDAASNLVGRKFGTHRLPWRRGMTLEGSAAFCAAAFPAAFGMMLYVSTGRQTEALTVPAALALAAAAAVTGAVAETISYRLEDNLTVPLGSAGVVWLASRFLGVL